VLVPVAGIVLGVSLLVGGVRHGIQRFDDKIAGLDSTLLVLAAVLVFEAVLRIASPPTVVGGAVIATAAAGVVVNLGVTWQLSRANRRSLNVEASFRHILTDLYALIGTLIAGVVIVTTGFERADAIASLVVAGLMIYAGVVLLWKAGRILLEAAPADLDPEEIGSVLAAHAPRRQRPRPAYLGADFGLSVVIGARARASER